MAEATGPTRTDEARVALITGAGRGIGRAAAIELAGRGHALALLARTEADLRETARLAGGGLVLPADITDSRQVDAAVSRVLGTYGRIDAVVNAAGIAPALPLEQMTDPQWHAVIDSNLSGVFYVCRAVWPAFRRQGGGVVVNLSSLACRDPFPGFGAYGAAKAGLNILGLVLAREGQEIGVRVHTLALGAVETQLFRTLLSEQEFPPERTMSPEEVTRVVAACVVGDLRYTSGEVIYMHKTV